MKRASWDFLIKNARNVAKLQDAARARGEKDMISFTTIRRDLIENLPEIKVSILCLDPEHNLIDVASIPMKPKSRKILVESSYIPVNRVIS